MESNNRQIGVAELVNMTIALNMPLSYFLEASDPEADGLYKAEMDLEHA